MDSRAIPSPDELLTHAAWVRRLAYGLVRDAARADDVVQETWRAALERPPSHGANPRAWLGRVARNAARQEGRAEARRAAREERAARPEAQADTAELVERAELQREVVEHVLALEPVYREVVLLRWFEDLPPRAIARRTGAPVNTVRTRLQRALERLRERLDERHGDRRSWCLALLPLARRGAPAVPGSVLSTLTGWTLAMKLPLTLAALTVAAVTLVVLGNGDDAPSISAESTAAAEPALAPPVAAPPSPAAAERAPVAAARPTASAEPTPLTIVTHGPTEMLRGRLVDVEGRPLADVELRWADPRRPRIEDHRLVGGGGFSMDLPPFVEEHLRTEPGALAELRRELGLPDDVLPGGFEAPTARTSLDGRFELAADTPHGRLELADPTRVLVGSGERVVDGERHRLWVAAPAVDVAGVVVDPEGRPLEGARVRADCSLSAMPAFPWTLEGGGWWHRQEVTEDDGRFRFARVPTHGSRVYASRRDLRMDSVAVPAAGGAGLRLVLRPQAPTLRPRLAGVVLDPAGSPAAGVFVHFGQDGTSTDEHGRFDLELTSLHESHGLAVTSGGAAAVLPDLGRRLRALPKNERELLDLVVRMRPALEIRGRVLHADGSPYRGVDVDVADPTVPWSTLAAFEQQVAGVSLARFGRLDRTNGDGAFVLRGLLERTYRPRVVDDRRNLVVVGDPVAADTTNFELRVPADALRERLSGRVVSRRGEPVAGVSVTLSYLAADVGGAQQWYGLESVRTDAAGDFAFGPVSRRHVALSLSGPDVELTRHALPPEAPDDGVTVVVDLECRFRLDSATDADEFAVLDAAGEPLRVLAHSAGVTTAYRRVSRRDGEHPVCTVSDAAATMVLYDAEGAELRRIPLDLRPGRLQVVGP